MGAAHDLAKAHHHAERNAAAPAPPGQARTLRIKQEKQRHDRETARGVPAGKQRPGPGSAGTAPNSGKDIALPPYSIRSHGQECALVALRMPTTNGPIPINSMVTIRRAAAIDAPKQRQYRPDDHYLLQQAVVDQIQPIIVLPREMPAGGIVPRVADRPVQLFVAGEPQEYQAADQRAKTCQR